MATVQRKRPSVRITPGGAVPSRSTHKTTLSLGPLMFGVSFYSGLNSDEGSGRSEFIMADGKAIPVGRAKTRKDTLKLLKQTDEIIKGVMVEERFIPISDEELAGIALEEGISPILGFICLEDLDDLTYLVTESVYQVRPAKNKTVVVRTQKKLWTLLMDLLARQGAVALVKYMIRQGTAPNWGILDHRGDLRQLVYSGRVRPKIDLEALYTPTGEFEVDEREQKLMDTMFRGARLRGELTFPDERKALIQQIVEAKLAGKEVKVKKAQQVDEGQDLTSILEAAVEHISKKDAT